MSKKDFEGPEEPPVGDESPADESAEQGEEVPASAGASGPAAGDDAAAEDELTIEDILGAAQSPDAAAAAAAEAAEAVASPHELSLVHDLKRLQAEYANYRRRTEEQREIEIERAQGAAAKGLLPVLDDLDRAEKHGDLEEGTPFTAIAEKVRGLAEKMGLSTHGVAGEAFDPQQHEAIYQAPTPGVTVPTVLEVVEVGYRLGAVELRPAKVVVAVPAE
ncbi:nucleotide exchange factor GrpE [Microbacterium sp. P5_E9]